MPNVTAPGSSVLPADSARRGPRCGGAAATGLAIVFFVPSLSLDSLCVFAAGPSRGVLALVSA